MTRTKPSKLEKLALEVPCDLCGAKSWRWCVTSRGKRAGMVWATWLHTYRMGPIQDAWAMGYLEYEEYLVSLDDEALVSHMNWIKRVRDKAMGRAR